MIEIVINYDESRKEYKIYEPSTDTLMVSSNLTEALTILNKFLLDSGLSKVDILECPDISYHIDSPTMRSIVEGNIKLIKRLRTAPSGFAMSSQRFGGSSTGQQQSQPSGQQKKQQKSKGGQLSGATGFLGSYKKFGGGKKF